MKSTNGPLLRALLALVVAATLFGGGLAMATAGPASPPTAPEEAVARQPGDTQVIGDLGRTAGLAAGRAVVTTGGPAGTLPGGPMAFEYVDGLALGQRSGAGADPTSTTTPASTVASTTTTTEPPTTTTTEPPTTTTTEPPTTTTTEPPTTTTEPPTTTTTEPPTTTTTVPSGTVLSEEQARDIFSLYFAAEDLDKAISVAVCESGLNTAAYNPAGYAGLFQHAIAYWDDRSAAAGWSGSSIYDAHANAAVAAWLVYSSGWQHWPNC